MDTLKGENLRMIIYDDSAEAGVRRVSNLGNADIGERDGQGGWEKNCW